MKKTLLMLSALIAVMVPALLCAEIVLESEGNTNTFFRDGEKIAVQVMSTDTIFHNKIVSSEGEEINGPVAMYYKNGVKNADLKFKDGLPHGDVVIYHKNGKQHANYTIRMNVMNGKARIYDEQGRLFSISNYKNGINAGLQKEFYPETGKIKYKFNCKNGVNHGLAFAYDVNGKLSYCLIYSNGKLINTITKPLAWVFWLFS